MMTVRETEAASVQADIERIPALIGDLFRVVRALGDACPGRPFTPDGHLVGSIGEVVAAYTYGFILERCSTEGYDATTEDNQKVEIKLTGRSNVSISSDAAPALLVVLKLHPESGFAEVYNGPFPLELCRSKKASKIRVVRLQVAELGAINPSLLPEKHPLSELNRLLAADQTKMPDA